MPISAANPAGLPHVFLNMLERANKSLPMCNGGGERHPSCDGLASSNRALIAVVFRSQRADENFALDSVCRFMYPALVRAPLRGSSCALRRLALLLRLRRPAGYGFPPNLVRKERPKRFLRSLRKCKASALGSMAHSLNGAPIKIGKFNKRRQSCTRTK
jgi:hypothetical protein